MMPLISVIVPNYNNGPFLNETMESIFLQDYPNFEVLVIDDGSTDDSIDRLRKIPYPIKIIESKNYGVSSARNLGILSARGDFIALLDSDDVWEKSKLSKQMKLMMQENLELVYCHSKELDALEGKGKIRLAANSGHCYPLYKRFPSTAIIEAPCSSVIFKKSILHKAGLFDTSVPPPSEDWDFFRRLSRHANIGFCDEVLVQYRRHSGNATSKSVKGYYESNCHALRKMFTDDASIDFFERRWIWSKFHWGSTKRFIASGKYFSALNSLLRILLPILS